MIVPVTERTITLMRHGRSLVGPLRLSPAELPARSGEYDAAGVHVDEIPAAARGAAMASAIVVTSTLARSIASAAALGCTAAPADAVYDEAQLPSLGWRWPRLPVGWWLVVFRLLWLAGWSRGVESRAECTARAGRAARRLVDHAEHGPVLLVGHGITNRLIARHLVAAGWQADGRATSGHWAFVSYRTAVTATG